MNLRCLIRLGALLVTTGLAAAQPVLRLDFNDRSGNPAADTMPGFSAFLINSNISATVAQTNPTVRAFGNITVTLTGTGVNPGYNDFLRPEPTNNAAFTESLLLRDFVRSNSQIGDGGLNLSITGLASNLLYAVTIWSYDRTSEGRHASDWYANGQLMVDNYVFDGLVRPSFNDKYRFTFYARSDGNGRLLIAGKRDASSITEGGTLVIGVYLNALQLEPVLRLSSPEVRGGNLVMRVDSPQASQTHRLEQSLTLRSNSWTEVLSAVFSAPTNNVRTVTLPGPLPSPRYYRVRY